MKTRTLVIALALGFASEAVAGEYCIYREPKVGAVAQKCLTLQDTPQPKVERTKEIEPQGYKDMIAERLERKRIDADRQVAEAVANQPQPEPQWMPMFPIRNGNVVFQGGF